MNVCIHIYIYIHIDICIYIYTHMVYVNTINYNTDYTNNK